jgi:type IV pilus assembly protein PilA
MNMKNTKQARQQGFTLIELMIVIAIVGILSAVALPAYQDYTVRAKLSEALAVGGAAKVSVTEFYTINQRFSSSLGILGLTSDLAGEVADSLAVASGKINITLGSLSSLGAAGGKVISFSPLTNSAGIATWTCSSTVTEKNLLPSNCRG